MVTGGAGFIGSHLVDRLLGDGHEVTVVDDLSTGSLNNLNQGSAKQGLRVVEGDFADPEILKAELPEVSTVLHLAALTSVRYSIRHPDRVFEVNAMKTHSLLQACARDSVTRFILASTAAVYGNQSPPVSESVPVEPLSPYASSKVSAEASAQSFFHSFGLESVILRFMNVYGSRSESASEGVIPKFIAAIKKKKGFVVYGDGEQTRDFVHVDDVVEAITLAMSTSHSHGEVFNVGTGHPNSINGLVTLLQDLLPSRRLRATYLSKRKGEVRQSYASTYKASRLLGFKSTKELRFGLAEILKEKGIS
jgi:UDP-glucose 4-epimerase